MNIGKRYIEYKIAEYPEVNEQGFIEWVVVYKIDYLN